MTNFVLFLSKKLSMKTIFTTIYTSTFHRKYMGVLLISCVNEIFNFICSEDTMKINHNCKNNTLSRKTCLKVCNYNGFQKLLAQLRKTMLFR